MPLPSLSPRILAVCSLCVALIGLFMLSQSRVIDTRRDGRPFTYQWRPSPVPGSGNEPWTADYTSSEDDVAQVEYILGLYEQERAGAVCHVGAGPILWGLIYRLPAAHVLIRDIPGSVIDLKSVSDVKLASHQSIGTRDFPARCGLVVAHFHHGDNTSVAEVAATVVALRGSSAPDARVVWTNFRSYLGSSDRYYHLVHHSWKKAIADVDNGLAPLNCSRPPVKSAACVAEYYTPPPKKQCYTYLSVRLMLPRETQYITEFIIYHKYIVGFDCLHVNVFGSASQDRAFVDQILAPWVAEGWLFVGPDAMYHPLYSNFPERVSTWTGYWDIDEFWSFHTDDLGDIRSHLRSYEKFEGIILDRENFVPGGLLHNPRGPTFEHPEYLALEHYDTAAVVNRPDFPSFCGKHICLAGKCSKKQNAHRLYPMDDEHSGVVDGRQTIIKKDYFSPVDDEWGQVMNRPERHVGWPLRLNHLLYRSLDDCNERAKDGGWRATFSWMCDAIAGKGDFKDNLIMYKDTTILRHIPALKRYIRAHFVSINTTKVEKN